MAFSFMEFGNPLQDSCDIHTASFGMESQPHAGGFNRRAQIHDMIFTKATDSNLSSVLFEYCVAGRKIDEVALKLYRSEESTAPYVTYLLKMVYVTTFLTRSPIDEFTLTAETITYRTA